MRKLWLLVFTVLFQSLSTFAQNTPEAHNFRKEKGLFGNRCQEYRSYLRKLPADVRYDIEVKDGIIYFAFPSIDHFKKIFDKDSDGIAVDIVHKDQFQCGVVPNFDTSSPYKGFLLPPKFKKELEKNIDLDAFNNVVVEYGVLPPQFIASDVECNLLVLQKKALCDYKSISGFNYGSWDLLEMGLYRDSKPSSREASNLQTFKKTIEFAIPFEKNKSSFSQEDIQPLYDSLKLTNYDIKEMSILAFSSVEGTIELNDKLQRERAESVVEALQAYQSTKINMNVITKENWGQFARDIDGTRFSYLRKYSKDELKSLLAQDKRLLDSLEPILAKHRKGMIKLKLQLNLSDYEDHPEKLKHVFQQSLAEPDLDQALFVQEKIIENIKDDKLPDEFINQLEIPKESKYGPLFINIILFNWERQNVELMESIRKIEKLEEIFPNSPKLKYNLLVLKIRAWTEGEAPGIDRNTLKKLLEEVKKTDIDPTLVKRLEINYHLLLAQYLVYEKKFREKRKSINIIHQQYKNLELKDTEVLSLAKFLATYSEFKAAEEVLYSRLSSDHVPEDLLFYYIELTIGNPEKTSTSAYKGILQKALDTNVQRYCRLFLPRSQGGFSFQLKENPVLKSSYCGRCEQNL